MPGCEHGLDPEAMAADPRVAERSGGAVMNRDSAPALEPIMARLAAGGRQCADQWGDRGSSAGEEIADLIESDAAARLMAGEEVSLSRYLAAVPNLVDFDAALDSAIEVSCVAASRAGDTDPAESPILAQPDLAAEI